MGKLYLNLRTTSFRNLTLLEVTSCREAEFPDYFYCYSLLVNEMFLWNKIPSHVLEAGNSISKFKQALHR